MVSSGNGGTHKLYETGDKKPCLIDTQNQKGGITLPPIIGRPVLPPIGELLPGGVCRKFRRGRPPIGTLPPSGLTPGMPGGVRPPIGTLPPSGLTPGMPGGVRPPIGTLPPSGLTPGMPGGVRPPVGTLPPSGLTPGMPGGVRPPIGTLPPSGLTPGMPGGVQPPIGAGPPGGTATGGTGGGAALGGGAVAGGLAATGQGRLAGAVRPGVDCIDPRTTPTDGDERPICPAEVLAGEVPLTEGRDLGAPTLWNVWVEPLYVSVRDQRNGLDMDTDLVSLTLGLDRRIDENGVVGGLLSLMKSETDGFDDALQTDVRGFSVGPYAAYRLSPRWAVDGSLTYGQYDNDVEMGALDGDYTSRQIAGSANLHGQFEAGEYLIRPQASLFYAHIDTDAYGLKGDFGPLSLDVPVPDDQFNYGVLGATAEVSRVFVHEDKFYMPYAEVGIGYEFERPNDGEILTGNLSYYTPSAWTGTVRAGVRMLVRDNVQVDVAGGYLSIGQDGLDIWEGKVLVSVGF